MAAMLYREPYVFEFFQAVRVLERISPDREPVGRFVPPPTEVVRFGVHPSTSFPASEIQSLEANESGPPLMRVNFMGLIGALGMLPLPYTLMVLERLRSKDAVLRDFLDLFHHRIISLFYQAWEKYRFNVSYERGERDKFSHHLLDVVGLGTPGLQDRQEVPDDALLFYTGLLGLHSRSALGLRQVLTDYFRVPVEIEQFVGAWYPIDRDTQCAVGEERRGSEQLGFGAVVGDAIWDQQSRIRIRLGPLTLEQYKDFLPGRPGNNALKAITRFYAGGEFDSEVELILQRDQVPRCELTGLEQEIMLGWTSWIKSAPFRRDPADTVLEL
jgi:type VI secretion system protein ImpH